MVEALYQAQIARRHDTKNHRALPAADQPTPIDFSSNDYLGLSRNPLLLQAANTAGATFGVGATGARLLSGNHPIFGAFEAAIAQCKRTEAALLFNTGFQCNMAVLACLLDKKTLKNNALVFFDRLNHASLYQAVFLSQATLVRYRHNDTAHLSSLLHAYKNDKRPKFIVTETLFGMDGDIAPITVIVQLARQYHAFLYLDEAHATGLIGVNGYGLSTTVDLTGISYVIMGTCSKALGVSGAYIACNKLVKEYLVNFCPGFIYSTANSPLVIGAAYQAWQLLPQLHNERHSLTDNSRYLREQCQKIGLNTGTSCTSIVPILLGNEESAHRAQAHLLTHGIKVSCIKPPTVPPGTARLRIAINVSHSKQDIDQLLAALTLL